MRGGAFAPQSRDLDSARLTMQAVAPPRRPFHIGPRAEIANDAPAQPELTSSARSSVARIAALCAFGAVCFGLLVSRRPEVLTQPQFYAEDGQAWYANAHNLGLISVMTPVGGYLNSFQRLVGLSTAPLGLVDAARTMAVIALAVQTLPALFFASRRLCNVVADDRARLGIALLYIIIPNPELTANLTNTQWHLAALAFLVIVAAPPRSRTGRAFDILVLALSALSGPFAIFLLPIAIARYRHELRGWRLCEIGLLGTAMAIQFAILAFTAHSTPRSALTLGASPTLVPPIIANQLLARFTAHAVAPSDLAITSCIALAVVVTITVGLLHAERELRYFAALAVAIVVTGLLLPYSNPYVHQQDATAWAAIATGGAANRYFFLTSVLLVIAVVKLAVGLSHSRWSGALAIIAVIGATIVASLPTWQYTPLSEEHLARYQTLIDGAKSGSIITIPIDPPGWTMQVKAG
ncbi:MAG: hypothetical protein JOY80_04105 [Candidatus Dormibacteraeota bacterium]|nr:hypothetical protein [Candidatus Dormibacteraeota bacterium]